MLVVVAFVAFTDKPEPRKVSAYFSRAVSVYKGSEVRVMGVKIGTVTSGTTPSATITGTSPDLTLGLVLPKGDRGDKGETGAPGVVSSASSYVLVGPGRPDTPLALIHL